MVRARDIATAAVVLTFGAGVGLGGVAVSGPGDPSLGPDGAAHLLDAARAHSPAAAETAPARVVLETLVGSASYYANSLAGRRTASGERYDPREMVAAHRTLPFGSLLRVTNEANGRSVQVRVVDRGPFARGRVLDLSRRAAEELDFIRQGHTRVTIEVLEQEGGV